MQKLRIREDKAKQRKWEKRNGIRKKLYMELQIRCKNHGKKDKKKIRV
jgi:hypothetical protein